VKEGKEKIMKEEWIVELTETDSEIWSSDIDCNSREESIEEGMKYAKEDGLKSFRIGKAIPCSIPNIDIDLVLERAREQLYDEVGEPAEVYLDGVTKEQIKELDEQLYEVFYQWNKKYKLEPSCYNVINDEVIEVK